MKKLLVTTILLITIFTITNGQIRRNQLLGDWATNNTDSIYFKADTVEFIQDINHFNNTEICNLIVLRISKTDFRLINAYKCSEPGIEEWANGKQSLKIKGSMNKQLIEIKVLGEVERFEILTYEEKRVDRYPWDIKILKLKRI